MQAGACFAHTALQACCIIVTIYCIVYSLLSQARVCSICFWSIRRTPVKPGHKDSGYKDSWVATTHFQVTPTHTPVHCCTFIHQHIDTRTETNDALVNRFDCSPVQRPAASLLLHEWPEYDASLSMMPHQGPADTCFRGLPSLPDPEVFNILNTSA